jgi:hypothetical protein
VSRKSRTIEAHLIRHARIRKKGQHEKEGRKKQVRLMNGGHNKTWPRVIFLYCRFHQGGEKITRNWPSETLETSPWQPASEKIRTKITPFYSRKVNGRDNHTSEQHEPVARSTW